MRRNLSHRVRSRLEHAMALRVDDVDLTRDRALVERYQAGDSGAFDELYKRYYQRLERFCRKRVGDSHEAEEVAQEAFVRALSAMPRLEGERRFYPWVSVIAARLCVDTHRRRARTSPSDEIDLGTIDGGQDKVLDAVDIDLLRTAMENLGPRHREVLDLREQQGWSYQRIAEHYDVSLGTVEALLFRARKALKREFLKAAGGERPGFLAGLPVVGWLGRRVAAWRAKVEALTGPNLAPLAAKVSMAVMVGSAAVFVGAHSGATHAPHPQVRTVAPAAAGVTSLASSASAPAPAAVGTAAPAAASAAPAAAHATAPATAAKPASSSVKVLSTTVGGANESRNYADTAPVHHDDGHLVAGVDPPTVSQSLATSVQDYVGHLLPGGK